MKKKANPGILEEIFIEDVSGRYEKQMILQSFNAVEFFVAAIDLNGNILFINRRGEELLGYDSNEIVGKNLVEDFIIISKKKQQREILNNILKGITNPSSKTRYHLRRRVGKKIILEAKNKIIYDRENNAAGIIISGENITGYVTREHNLQDAVNLYSILTENVPGISLFLFDNNMRFLIAKGIEIQNLGLASEDFEGKTLHEIENDEIKRIWIPLFRSALNNTKLSSEYEYKSFIYQISILPVLNNRDEVFLGIAINQNITERKKAVRRLSKYTREAEKAKLETRDFLAHISHEIRTPLSAIIGFTEQLTETRMDRKQKEFLKIITEASGHLMLLIDDVLALSKIEAGELHLIAAPFKIIHTVEHIYHSFLHRVKEKDLDFKYHVDEALDIVLIGDPLRLRQILINMLNNAVKFTFEGQIEIKCFIEKEARDEVTVRFEVTDTGIGISHEKQKIIFKPFIQVDPSISRKSGGTGLGLTICKKLVEMQNGKVSVSSRVGAGTTFRFWLPFKKGKETDKLYTGREIIDKEALKGIRVLLVDDDNFSCILGKIILTKFNCSTDIAINGEEARIKLSSSQYDIILLDMHMPGISGIEVVKFLREIRHDWSVKIIAVTASVLKGELVDYYKAGINDFLIKPFREKDIYYKICNVLQIGDNIHEPSRAELVLKEELIRGSYDLAELEKITEGNEKLRRKMLTIFIENTKKAVTTFEQLLEAEEWNKIGEIAHRIVPSYRHLHAEDIAADLSELKTRSLSDPDHNSISVIINKITGKMRMLITDLQSEINH